jgi:hypothetical protein
MIKHLKHHDVPWRLWTSALAAVTAALTLTSEASAGPTPTGLSCPSGYTLVFESNVLTCVKVLNSGTVKDVDAPICQRGGLSVKTGADTCSYGFTPQCSSDYFLRVDHSGRTDQCVHYGYDYRPPISI